MTVNGTDEAWNPRTREQSGVRSAFSGFLLVCRWGFISVLAVLLVAGMVWQFPVKVMMILIGLLAVQVLLPRRPRRFVQVVILLGLMVLLVWIVAPPEEDEGAGWRPYAFLQDLSSLEARRKVAAEGEDAAAFYLQLFSDFDGNRAEQIFHRQDPELRTLEGAWRAKEFPLLARQYEDDSRPIQLLLSAAAAPGCRLPVPSEWNAFEDRMRQMSYLKSWVRILMRRAFLDLGEGRREAALDKMIAVRRVAEHLYQQQELLCRAAALPVEQYAAHGFYYLIVRGSATAEELARIEAASRNGYDFREDWPVIFDSLKLVVKNTGGLLYEVNGEGQARRSRRIPEAINSQFDLKMRFGGAKSAISRLGLAVHWLVLPGTPEKLSEWIDTTYQDYFERSGVGAAHRRMTRMLTLSIKLNARKFIARTAAYWTGMYPILDDKSKRSEATRRATLVLAALRRERDRTGRWPDSLDAIAEHVPSEVVTDPLNRGPFEYRRRGDMIRLYSRGPNNMDEGGHFDLFEPELDDLVFWPVVEPPEPVPSDQ